MSGRKTWRRGRGRLGSSESELSPTALGGLDRQFGEALGLAASCRVLSDSSRTAGDPLTAVALERLSTDLNDQAAILAPLVRPEPPAGAPPFPEHSGTGVDNCLAELDDRLSRAALVAQTDAMSPGLEATVAGLLQTLASHYRTRRELILVCTLLDSA
jgi:hypothetical protein